MNKVPKALSEGEETFAMHCQCYKLVPVREYRFMEGRRYRFDFAWPEEKIAVEVEGGSWSGGRHSRGKGFAEDCLKYSNAALLGWRVFRFTTDQVQAGIAIDMVVAALA